MPYPNAFRAVGFLPSRKTGKISPRTFERNVVAGRLPIGTQANSDIAIGDAYGLDPAANAFRSTAASLVRGICVGFRMAPLAGVMGASTTVAGGGVFAVPGGPVSQDYIPQASPGTIIGAESALDEYVVQADTFAVGNIGGLFNLLDASPDATLRQSRQSMNIGGGAGLQFRTVDIDPSPADNQYGTNARIKVTLEQVLA